MNLGAEMSMRYFVPFSITPYHSIGFAQMSSKTNISIYQSRRNKGCRIHLVLEFDTFKDDF